MTFRRLATLSLVATLTAGACAPLAEGPAARRERAAEAKFPPTGRLIEVAGLTIHADQRGTGPDVVLLHGASGNTRDFTFALADRLARDFRVTAFDRPGLGWSDDAGRAGSDPRVQAGVLRAAAAELGLRRPVVVGHSYGASVALAWGLADPEGTGAVVSLAGATMPWRGGLGPWYPLASSDFGRATFIPVIAAVLSRGRADGAIEGIFAPDAVPAGYADYIGVGLTLRRETLHANARQVNALKRNLQEMAKGYPDLALPVEIVHGTRDSIVPFDLHATALAARLPDARLTRIEGAGHMIHHARPEEVAAAIRRAARRAGTL